MLKGRALVATGGSEHYVEFPEHLLFCDDNQRNSLHEMDPLADYGAPDRGFCYHCKEPMFWKAGWWIVERVVIEEEPV